MQTDMCRLPVSIYNIRTDIGSLLFLSNILKYVYKTVIIDKELIFILQELIAGRFVCGLSNGFGYICATMYIGEISPANIRGTLTSTLTVAAKFGLFVEWAIGPFLSIRNLALVSSLIPILFFVSLISLPESPYHLMRRGRNQEAVTCLMQLREATDVSKEMEMIEKSIKYDLSNNTGLWELVSVSGNRKCVFIS